MITIYTYGECHLAKKLRPKVDQTFDVRNIQNPHRFKMNDEQRWAWVVNSEKGQRWIEAILSWAANHYQHYHLVNPRLAVVCSFGRHRSRAIAEEAARKLREVGFDVEVCHLSPLRGETRR